MENKKIKNAKEYVFNDIKFNSGLELFCYKSLVENGISFTFQPPRYTLLGKFTLEFKCYENIGKIFRDENKKILKSTKRFDLVDAVGQITYTPDFVGQDNEWIIETKGFANDSFPLKWKMYKQLLTAGGFKGILMKPTTQKEVLLCIDIILDSKKTQL